MYFPEFFPTVLSSIRENNLSTSSFYTYFVHFPRKNQSLGQQLNTEVALLLPRSIQTIRKLLRQENTGIREYVVCPRCNALYSMKDCIVHQNGRNESQVCGYVMYPNHPHLSKRNKCNTVLLKKIRVGCKNKLVPRKTFVYNSVIDGLKSLVCRRGFLQKCEHWLTCRCNTT